MVGSVWGPPKAVAEPSWSPVGLLQDDLGRPRGVGGASWSPLGAFGAPSEKALQGPRRPPFTRCFRSFLPTPRIHRFSHARQVAGGSRGDDHINCNSPQRHAPRDSVRLLGTPHSDILGLREEGRGMKELGKQERRRRREMRRDSRGKQAAPPTHPRLRHIAPLSLSLSLSSPLLVIGIVSLLWSLF